MKIYKIVNLINQKIYVGKTVKTIKSRFKVHIKNAKTKINRYLYDAMNHYGYNNFKIELIEDINDLKGNKRERYWIKRLKSKYPYGYNMTDGGDGGYTLINWSEDKKQELYRKQAEKRKGQHYHTIESKKILSDLHIGNKLSTETKIKISNTNKRKGIKPPINIMIGENHPMYNKTHTIEAREKISKSKKGKTWEELFGIEYAQKKRQMMKKRMKGNNYANINNR